MKYQYIESGFTLTEMMIVIAIIGILATVSVPAYEEYIASTRRSACLLEVKGYSNQVFYILNDQNEIAVTDSPNLSACQFITDATGWTAANQQKIIAIAKPPSNARIECDIPNGAPCRVLP